MRQLVTFVESCQEETDHKVDLMRWINQGLVSTTTYCNTVYNTVCHHAAETECKTTRYTVQQRECSWYASYSMSENNELKPQVIVMMVITSMK